jgi:hypothetical protein
MAEVQGLSTTAVFPSPSPVPPGLPCTEATPMPAQEIVLSLSSPASLNALAEHFFDGYEHRTRTPTVPSAPSLLGSGYATAEGSPTSGWSYSTGPPSPAPSSLRMPSHRWSQIMMTKAKAYQIIPRGPSRSNLSHHRRSAAHSMEEGTTTPTRVLGGPILLDLRRRSQRCNR